MGAFFRSYGEAWDFFLGRKEPLEWFLEDFPEEEVFAIEGWLIEPSPAVKASAARIQERLRQFSWLVAIPDHFLHVWFGDARALGDRTNSWAGSGAAEIEYRNVSCFHSAVVVDAHAPSLARMIEGTDLDPETFLPHLTIAITRERHDPAELRDVLIPLRDARVATETAMQVKRVRVPASRTTFLQPWDVLEVVAL